MIDTILFDLDGTLLGYNQNEFIEIYFTEIKKVFSREGFDPELAVKALWAGTKSMVLNDGTKLNSEQFWDKFASIMNLSNQQLKDVENACDIFYSNEFNTIKSILKTENINKPRQIVHMLASKGFKIVLATNPLFPSVAANSRLKWIGLEPLDFCLITDYSNCNYCKPNPNYYLDILKKINKKPQQCLMVGNNTAEDMVAGDLGIETFLVTEHLENEKNLDISIFKHGTLSDLEAYLVSLS